jgi:hypothetical protein
MEKGIVSMERKVCAVCDKEFDSGALFLQNRNMNHPKLEQYTVTRMGICPEHSKEGYVVLIGIDPAKSDSNSVWRTGAVCHLKKEVAHGLFPNVRDWSYADERIFEQLNERVVK